MKSQFIVFEGIDGCGKSTQAKLFVGRLFDYNKFMDVLLTREPWQSEEIRRRIREESDAYSNASLMADLYINDRKKHLQELVVPSLEQGIWVVSDRYKFSTLTYQTAQGLSMDDLIARHSGLLVPDLTFVVDVPVSVALNRNDGKDKKFEGNPEFQEKLRRNYLEAVRRHLQMGEKIVIVNGTLPREEVSDLVWQNFTSNLQN